MPRLLPIAAVLVAAVVFAAGSQEGVRYGSGNNSLGPLAKLNDAQLGQQIVGMAPVQKVTQIDRLGARATLWKAGDATLAADATHEERLATLAVLQRAGAAGSETDLLIARPDGTRVPLTVIVDPAGVLTVHSGAPVKELLSPALTAEEIATTYHLDPFTAEGAPWKPAELAAVAAALSRLTPEEVALVGGLGFRRKGTDPAGRAAYYRRSDDGMTIDVYDKTFAYDAEYFVGSVDAPVPQSVGTMLHEMAHAMSDFQGRTKAIAANRAVAEVRALQDKAKADPTPENKAALREKAEPARALRGAINALDKVMLTKGRAAERSYAAVVDPRTSVSVYGRTSMDENLAESFVLSKLDVPALERVAPKGLAWFTEKRFVGEAQKPLD